MQALRLNRRNKSVDNLTPVPETAPPLPTQPSTPMRSYSLAPTDALAVPSQPANRVPSPVYVPQLSPQIEQADRRMLHMQLLSMPMHRSVLGQLIVRCLTLPWVNAPSGLAVCELPDDESWNAIDIAEAINLLACGAQAYTAPYARLLGVDGIGKLNRMLAQSGLTTIAPTSTPTPWFVVMTRQPPDFVMAGFKKTHKANQPSMQSTVTHNSSSDSHASQSAFPPISPNSQTPPGRPTRTMENLMQAIKDAPRDSKQAHDAARALLMAERDRYAACGVPLMRGSSTQNIRDTLENIGRLAMSDEPEEYDASRDMMVAKARHSARMHAGSPKV